MASVKIVLLIDAYLPGPHSTAKLFHDLAAEFVRRGHEAVVAAADDALDRPCQETVEDGIRVFRVRTGRIKGAGLLRRGWNERRLSSTFWRAGREFWEGLRADLIVSVSPTLFFADLIRRLKRIWGCPSYLVLRDLQPQWLVDAGVLRKGPAYLYLKWKERALYRSADVIGVQSPANLRYFEERGWDRRYRLEVLYNWIATGPPPSRTADFRAAWGLEGKVVFFFGGNLGIAQDMDNVLRLAEALRGDPRATFLVVGDGTELPRFREAVRSRGLDHVVVRDAVSQEEYAALAGQFDVGLVSLAAGLKTHNFPGKLLGYMLASLPILASINPGNDLRAVLEEGGAGLVSWNGEDGLFAENARRLLEHPELRASMGRRARELLDRRFSVSAAADRILASVRSAT